MAAGRTIAAACVLVGLLSVPAALALDVNGDGTSDFWLREQPYLPYANVGSNCDVWQSNSPKHGRLYVRSPWVRGLPGLGRQKVGWRARFYDTVSGRTVWRGSWVYRYVLPYQGTRFGGGPDAGNGVYITHNSYWAGSQWYDHLAGDGTAIRAIVDAAWWNAKTRTWTVKALRVQWVISTVNRTTGNGQTMTSSVPVKGGTC